MYACMYEKVCILGLRVVSGCSTTFLRRHAPPHWIVEVFRVLELEPKVSQRFGH